MDLNSLNTPHAVAGIATAAALAGAYLRPKIETAAKALPVMIVSMAESKVAAAAAAGKIDPPTVRLLKALARAAFAWADEEMPQEVGPAKMEKLLDRLAALPLVGVLVRVDRDGCRQMLQTEFAAMRAEVAQEAKGEAAAPAPAGLPPGPPNPPSPPPVQRVG